MAKENLVSVVFSTEEMEQAKTNIDALLAMLGPKCISLTPEERQEFGRIGEKTENFSRKVVQYMIEQPEFTPNFIDGEETKADFDAREFLKSLLKQLNTLRNMADDTALLLGFDLYQSELGYYQNLGMLNERGVNGAKAIYEDLKARFPGGKRRKNNGKNDADKRDD